MLNLVLITGIIITIATGIPVFLQLRAHPKGLVICFFTEMWERFSYYGMRGLLIYYLTKHFLFTDGHAAQQYSSYATMIYLMPLIGGLVADRWIGTRKAVMFGGILLVLGHFGMALEGAPAQQTLVYQGHSYEFVQADGKASKLKIGDGVYTVASDDTQNLTIAGLPVNAPVPSVISKGQYQTGVKVVTPWAETAFYLSISLIIMGVGFLKPNISTIVGQLYRDRDPRRDSGFQLYYFGINLGSFWAAILCGWLGQTYGWGYGFGLAGLGMLAGLLVFALGKGLLDGKGMAPNPEVLKAKVANVISKESLIYLVAVASVAIIYFLVQQNTVVLYVLCALSALMLGYVIYNMCTRFTRAENFRLALALLLSLASIVFFTLEELSGSALSLFTDRNVNLEFLPAPIHLGQLLLASSKQVAAMGGVPAGTTWIDMGITAAQTQMINTGFILILAPIFAALFAFLGNRNADPDPVKKFSVGIVATGLGFMVLVWGAPLANGAFQLPLIFLVVSYLLTTVGEMALSPVGLSQQTKLSPVMVVSTMMALWFTGLSWAQFLGGKITEMTASFTIGGEVVDPGAALHTSLTVFSQIGLMTMAFGVGLFVLSFFIKGWSHGANDSTPERLETEVR